MLHLNAALAPPLLPAPSPLVSCAAHPIHSACPLNCPMQIGLKPSMWSTLYLAFKWAVPVLLGGLCVVYSLWWHRAVISSPHLHVSSLVMTVDLVLSTRTNTDKADQPTARPWAGPKWSPHSIPTHTGTRPGESESDPGPDPDPGRASRAAGHAPQCPSLASLAAPAYHPLSRRGRVCPAGQLPSRSSWILARPQARSRSTHVPAPGSEGRGGGSGSSKAGGSKTGSSSKASSGSSKAGSGKASSSGSSQAGSSSKASSGKVRGRKGGKPLRQVAGLASWLTDYRRLGIAAVLLVAWTAWGGGRWQQRPLAQGVAATLVRTCRSLPIAAFDPTSLIYRWTGVLAPPPAPPSGRKSSGGGGGGGPGAKGGKAKKGGGVGAGRQPAKRPLMLEIQAPPLPAPAPPQARTSESRSESGSGPESGPISAGLAGVVPGPSNVGRAVKVDGAGGVTPGGGGKPGPQPGGKGQGKGKGAAPLTPNNHKPGKPAKDGTVPPSRPAGAGGSSSSATAATASFSAVLLASPAAAPEAAGGGKVAVAGGKAQMTGKETPAAVSGQLPAYPSSTAPAPSAAAAARNATAAPSNAAAAPSTAVPGTAPAPSPAAPAPAAAAVTTRAAAAAPTTKASYAAAAKTTRVSKAPAAAAAKPTAAPAPPTPPSTSTPPAPAPASGQQPSLSSLFVGLNPALAHILQQTGLGGGSVRAPNPATAATPAPSTSTPPPSASTPLSCSKSPGAATAASLRAEDAEAQGQAGLPASPATASHLLSSAAGHSRKGGADDPDAHICVICQVGGRGTGACLLWKSWGRGGMPAREVVGDTYLPACSRGTSTAPSTCQHWHTS